MQEQASPAFMAPLESRLTALRMQLQRKQDYIFKPDQLSRIKSVTGGYVETFLPDVGLGQICTIETSDQTGPLSLIVIKQTVDTTILVPLQSLIGVRRHDRIRYSVSLNHIRVSQAVLGSTLGYETYEKIPESGAGITLPIAPSIEAQTAQPSDQLIPGTEQDTGALIYGGAYFLNAPESWTPALRALILGPAFDAIICISPRPWSAIFATEDADLKRAARPKCTHLTTPTRFNIVGQNISLAIASTIARSFALMGLNVALLADNDICGGANFDDFALDLKGERISCPIQFHHVFEQNGCFDRGSVTHLFGLPMAV